MAAAGAGRRSADVSGDRLFNPVTVKKPLILCGMGGVSLMLTHRADLVIYFNFRFVWGPLPSPDELATYLATRSDKHGPGGSHWSVFAGRWSGARKGTKERKDLGLIEFCEHYDTIELWFDADPNEQLQLSWLLDYFRPHANIVAKLKLRLIHFELMMPHREELERVKVPAVDVTADKLEAASALWQAYRASTPQACFNLLASDLSALPLLKPALSDLIEELPSGATGLGAMEMRLLELIAIGFLTTNGLFYLRGLHQRRVFGSNEIGYLLEGLAHGPTPAIAGLDDELRILDRENLRDRDAAFKRSQPSLTEFGRAILAHQEDFSRHNPIDRWWGGTRLTSDRLWRRDARLVAP